MKYNFTAPPSKTPQNLFFEIPDLPATISPVITGTTPIDPVPPTNQPPSAEAGTDQTITLPQNSVRLLGRGVDPEGLGVTFLWTKVSGGAASIMSPNAANTDVNGLVKGDYVFRITVTDDKGAINTDQVNVTVKSEVIVVPPTPGKYEGFGVAAASVVNQGLIINVDSKSVFDANLKSNRILRFVKSFVLSGRYTLNNISNLWIDANGFDVTIDCNEGNALSIEGSGCGFILVSGMRTINSPVDGINVVDGAHDIIIDHCSSYKNGDGNIDIAGGIRVTISNSIMGGGKPGWGGACLITAPNVSGFLNLINPATSNAEGERGPLVHHNYGADANPHADWRNNVTMNFGRSGGTGSGYGTAIAYTAKGNVVNNYYHDKESASNSISSSDGYGGGNTGQVYSAGNHITNGTTIYSASMANNHAEFPIPAANRITMLTALEAKAKVKAQVGTAVKNSYEQGLINAIP